MTNKLTFNVHILISYFDLLSCCITLDSSVHLDLIYTIKYSDKYGGNNILVIIPIFQNNGSEHCWSCMPSGQENHI